MAFVPPTFGNYGKSTKDLFKKKYDFDYSFKSIRRADGLTFESSFTQDKAGNNRGVINMKCKCNKSGEGEINVTTDKNNENKASWKFNKYVSGLSTTVAASTKDDEIKGEKPVLSIDNEFTRQNAAFTAVLKSNTDVHKLKTTGSFGFNDFSVGAAASFDFTKGFDIADYNVGAEYSRPAYTVSAATERKLENVTLSYFHRPAAGYVFGARVATDLALTNPKLTLGGETKVNANVNLKVKIDSDSTVSTALEQRLANPSMAVGVAATFKPLEFNQSVKAANFGFNITIGDY